MIKTTKKTGIFVLLIIIVVGGACFMNSRFRNPEKLFYKEFGFVLSESAKTANYRYYRDEEILCAKIKFNEGDLDYYINNFKEYYQNKGSIIKPGDLILDYSDDNSWWDLNREDAIFAYRAFSAGKVVKTRNIYTFIVNDHNGSCSLYVVC